MADPAATPKVELTDEHYEAIEQRMAVMVETLTGRLKGLQKAQDDKMNEFMGNMQKLVEGIKTPAPAADPDGKGKDRENKDVDQQYQVALNDMKAKMADVVARAEAADKRAAEERSKNRNAALRKLVEEGLVKHGVEDQFIRNLAISSLKEEGRFKWEDDDADDSRAVFVGDDGVPVTLDQGLKSYMKTPEAQKLLPPRGVKGAGTRPRGTATVLDKDTVLEELFGNIANQMR